MAKQCLKVRLTQVSGDLETRRTLHISEKDGMGGDGIDHIHLMMYKDGHEDWCEVALEDLEEIYRKKKNRN